MSYCRNCGNQLSDGSVFCSKCGISLNENKGGTSPPPNSSAKSDYSKGDSLHFGYSSKTVTRLFFLIAIILIIAIIVTITINDEIAKLEKLYDRNWAYKYKEAINKCISYRKFNTFFDILLIAALVWRCLLTRKNYLRIYDEHISGVSCLPIGVSTVEISNLSINRIHSVYAKNNDTLVVEADKKYVFLIDNAEKAHLELYKKIHKN